MGLAYAGGSCSRRNRVCSVIGVTVRATWGDGTTMRASRHVAGSGE
jgi:hypothetical protein